MIMVLRYNCILIIYLLVCGINGQLDAGIVKVNKNVKKSFSSAKRYPRSQKKVGANTHCSIGAFHTVRVLLKSWQLNQAESIKVHSSGDFLLINPERKSAMVPVSGHELTISSRHGCLFVQGKKVRPECFCIAVKQGYITFNGKHYKGTIRVARDSKHFYIINCVDLEDYICSVLGTESWPGWPLEVNKVFAIASRSYVMAMMLQADKKKSLYHVRDTNVHQTYSGNHETRVLHQAVEQTKGLFLAFEGKPILAMFDSCCGGLIPAHIVDFDFSKVPYLKRYYPCKHCKRCKIYQWRAEYDCADLERLLEPYVPKLTGLKNLQIKKRDKAGIVQEVAIYPGNHIICGKKLFSLKPLKSFCFSINRKKNKICFEGRGFGHHVGLCQWGAREMVRDDWNYRRILRFYYPGTELVRLT